MGRSGVPPSLRPDVVRVVLGLAFRRNHARVCFCVSGPTSSSTPSSFLHESRLIFAILGLSSFIRFRASGVLRSFRLPIVRPLGRRACILCSARLQKEKYVVVLGNETQDVDQIIFRRHRHGLSLNGVPRVVRD